MKGDKAEAEKLFNEGCKHYELKEHEEAIACCIRVLEDLDTDNCCALCLQGLAVYGSTEAKEGKPAESIELLEKSKKDILNIIIMYFSCKANTEETFETFKKEILYKLLDSGNNDGEFFKNTIESDDIDKDELDNYKDIYIQSILIISELQIKGEYEEENLVAHYCKKSVSQSLLFDKSKLRLSAVNYSNDPTEGTALLDFLYGEKEYPAEQIEDKKHEAFAACFTFNCDSLNQFRLYGKENDKEGTGHSLVFKDDFFDRESKIAFRMNDDTTNEKLMLFRCIYIDPKTQYAITIGQEEKHLLFRKWLKESKIEPKDRNIPGDKEHEIDTIIEAVGDSYMEKTNEILKEVKGKMSKLRNYIKDKAIKPEIARRLLINLRYLTKRVAFKEEQECRMIKILSIFNNKDIIINSGQMFIEYKQEVSEHIAKVYFGPKAVDNELFQSMLKNKDLVDIDCKKSENPLA